MRRDFKDARVFVTGGSSGIGKATACLLAEAGAHVVICARGPERLAAAATEIAARASTSDRHVSGIVLDVRDAGADAIGGAAEEVCRRLGGLDLLVNNAGISHPGYLDTLPESVFRDVMETNYFGPVRITRAFLPRLRAQGSGHVSFVSSVLGFMGIFGYTAYAASKHAVTGFADCLRQEVKRDGIGVSVLFPPDTDTPQLHQENLIKPPETRAIAGNLKVVSADSVARAYLRGIASGRYHILPGFDARLSYVLYRHFPWLVRFVIDRGLKKRA